MLESTTTCSGPTHVLASRGTSPWYFEYEFHDHKMMLRRGSRDTTLRHDSRLSFQNRSRRTRRETVLHTTLNMVTRRGRSMNTIVIVAVVTVDDPAGLFDEPLHAATKLSEFQWRPVRLVVEPVEFQSRDAEYVGELDGERRLPTTGRTLDDHARQPCDRRFELFGHRRSLQNTERYWPHGRLFPVRISQMPSGPTRSRPLGALQ